MIIYISGLIDQVSDQHAGAASGEDPSSGASASNGSTPGAHGTEGTARRRRHTSGEGPVPTSDAVEKKYTPEQLEQVRK